MSELETKSSPLVAIIEMPKGTTLKLERTKTLLRQLRVDRELRVPVPASYGYIPQTLAGDGDPLDVFVISESSIPPLCEVSLEIIGALVCTDNGEQDDKILAVVNGSTASVHEDIRAIRSYLRTYKPGFVVGELVDAISATKLVDQARTAYLAPLFSN